MPTRAGQPTAEEIARAQQQGRGAPPPPPPGSGPPPEAAAVAALAATAGAVASAGVVASTLSAEAAAAAALAEASAGILAAFDRFLAIRLVEQQDDLETVLVRERPAMSIEDRLALIADELQRLRMFNAKARQRIEADLPAALRIRDKAEREEAVRALLERERRFVRQQEEASLGRILGAAHASAIRAASPEGAYWRVSEGCCPQCDAMGGKVWPWSVVDLYRPPLHPHCEGRCSLWTIAEAERMGWITEADYRTRDDMPGGDIMETVAELFDVDPDDLDEALALVEARYDRRYPKGTTKAGEFRPRRGGVVGLRAPGRRRRRGAPEVDASPVTQLARELDVQEIRTADLKRGDTVMVQGEPDVVEEARGNGLFVLRDAGLVLIDRDTVRGVPKDDRKTPDVRDEWPPRTEKPSADAAKVKGADVRVGDILHLQEVDDDGMVELDSRGAPVTRPWKVTELRRDQGGVQVVVASPDYGHERRTLNPGEEYLVDRSRRPADAGASDGVTRKAARDLAVGDVFTVEHADDVRDRGTFEVLGEPLEPDRVRPYNRGKVEVYVRRLPLNGMSDTGSELALDPDAVLEVSTERPRRPGLEGLDEDLLRRFEEAQEAEALATDRHLSSNPPSGARYDVDRALGRVGLTRADTMPDARERLKQERLAALKAREAVQLEVYAALLEQGRAYEIRDHSDRLKTKPWEVAVNPSTLGVIGGEQFVRDSGSSLRLARFKTREAAEKALSDLNGRELERLREKGVGSGEADPPEPGPGPHRHRFETNTDGTRTCALCGETQRKIAGRWTTESASGSGAPPPPATGGPTFDDVLDLAKAKRPSEAGELLDGFAYHPDLTRSEARDGVLHLPPGFFKQSRAVREKVLFRHLGGKLTDGLGEQGLAGLAEQDAHLSSRKAVVDTYFALNSPARDRMVELHPDAARLVATAAHERSLPLHPDAAKLVSAPSVADTPPERHPALRLSEQVNGMEHTPAYSLLMEAGYNSGEVDENGWVVWRSHDQGAAIHLNPYGDTLETRAVVDTAVQAPAEGIVGKPWQETLERLRGEGFALETNVTPWYEVVHPDGRAIAFRSAGGFDDPKISEARAFTPQAEEVASARRIGVGRDPLGTIKPGDSIDDVAPALRGAGYHGLNKGDGIRDFMRNATASGEREEVRLRVDDEGKVLEVGRPDRGSLAIVDDETYQQQREAARRAREEEAERARAAADEEKARQADQFAGMTAALATGKKAEVDKAMAGQPMHATVLHFRDELDWQIVTARRRSWKQGGGVVYTLRSPDGDTLTFSGVNSIEKVTTFKPAPKIERKRVTGRPPRDLKEFNGDALGRVDELAARFDGVGAISTILYGNKQDHAAHREWNGTMVMGREVKPSIERYLKKRNAGETTTDEERLDFYSALQTVQHEINHGVTAPGASRTKGSLTPRDYQGPGKGWEESLTEETAHLLVVDWLRSYDMPEVLEAVKRHPSDSRVRGVYRQYRDSMRTILDDAGVPPEERAQLLTDMKFRMTPAERLRHMGERLQARGHVRRDLRTGEDMKPENEAYYRMTTSERAWTSKTRATDWEPIVRPDLSDVRSGPSLADGSTAMLQSGQPVTILSTSPTEVVVELESGRVRSMKPEDFYDADRDGPMVKLPSGRSVVKGYSVMVADRAGEDPNSVFGKVVEVMGGDSNMVKVETDDGMVLWYPTERLA